jgi:hypothetical protein
MRRLTLALAALAAVAPPAALAQDAPAPAPAATAPAPEATAARFTLDTPVEQLVADTRAKAVLDARVPGLSGHAAYNMFKAMSLRMLQPHSQGRLTDELMAQIQADLAAIR